MGLEVVVGQATCPEVRATVCREESGCERKGDQSRAVVRAVHGACRVSSPSRTLRMVVMPKVSWEVQALAKAAASYSMLNMGLPAALAGW